MPIRFPASAPDDAPQAVSDFLSTRAQRNTLRAVVGAIALPDVAVADALRDYVLALDDIGAGAILERARPDHWRLLLFEQQRPVGEARVAVEDGSSIVSSVSSGPPTDGVLAALSAAEQLAEVRDADFEPRVLIVPALNAFALWLHRDGRDILLPFGAGWEDEGAPRPVDATTFERALMPLAERAQAAAQDPQQGG